MAPLLAVKRGGFDRLSLHRRMPSFDKLRMNGGWSVVIRRMLRRRLCPLADVIGWLPFWR
jgi:hypothetical protein